MENEPKKHHPKKRRNRHHILYPRQAWIKAGPVGMSLRGAFIIRLNCETHSKLHNEIDPRIGEEVQRDKLPNKRTLRHLKKEYNRNESKVRRLGPIEKIDWLDGKLDPSRDANQWLLSVLEYERMFLESHQEELM